MASAQNQLFSNSKLHALTYVLKYEPPMIGMIYKLNENDQKMRIYKIYLHGLIYKNDPDFITNQLFLEHALHINENNVSRKQMKNLVTKLLQHKEHKTDSNTGHKKEASNKQTEENVDLLGLDMPRGNQGIKIQDYGQPRQMMQNQQLHEYTPEYDAHDNLEFEGEIEDLEHDDHAFDYEQFEQETKPVEKHSRKMDFLRNLAHQRNHGDGMDFVVDDDHVQNLSY